MRIPPAEVLASWPTPNYTNPITRGPALLIINSIFLALCTIAVALRLYARTFVVRWFGLDDVLICIALILSVGVNIGVDIGSTKYGWDRHLWDIPLSWQEDSLKLAYATKLLFTAASNATMLSLLAFYYRLIREANVRWFRYILHSSVVFNLVAWFVFFVCQAVPCFPVKAYWSFVPGAKCMDEGSSTIAGGCVKTFVDLLVTTLPIPLVLRMKMTKSQRYGIAVLLGMGYIVTAAGAVRTYFTWKVYYASYDLTWTQYPAFLASAVENNLAVICACIPALRPLFQPFFGPAIGSLKTKLRSLSGERSTSSHTASQLFRKPSSKGFSAMRSDTERGDTRLVIEKRQSFELKDSRTL